MNCGKTRVCLQETQHGAASPHRSGFLRHLLAFGSASSERVRHVHQKLWDRKHQTGEPFRCFSCVKRAQMTCGDVLVRLTSSVTRTTWTETSRRRRRSSARGGASILQSTAEPVVVGTSLFLSDLSANLASFMNEFFFCQIQTCPGKLQPKPALKPTLTLSA